MSSLMNKKNYLIISLLSVIPNFFMLHAGQRYYGGMGGNDFYATAYFGKAYQLAQALNQNVDALTKLDTAINEVRRKHAGADGVAGVPLSPEDQTLLEKLTAARTNIINSLGKQEDSLGRAIALGFVGGKAQMIDGEIIDSLLKGVQVGVLYRGADAVGKAMAKRFESTADQIVGGVWDKVIGNTINFFGGIYNLIVHQGNTPFTVKELQGWQVIIDMSFDDLFKLLSTGHKYGSRATDMTLRMPEDGAEQQQQTALAWQLLIDGYVRQFDYCAMMIEEHLEYYDETEMITIFATELKRRLAEVQSLLSKSSSMNTLEKLLESQYTIISAFRRNIANLFGKLIENIDPMSANKKDSYNQAAKDYTGRDRYGLGGYDDERMPGAFGAAG